MKEKWKYKKLFYLMLIIVAFSLGVTAIIISGMINETDGKEAKYWFFEESMQTGKTVKLENVYIYSAENNQIEFLYDNIHYAVEGTLAQSFQGVADIVISGDQISKVRIKPDGASGVLYSYDDDSVTVICEPEDIETGTDGDKNKRADSIEELTRDTAIPIYKAEDGQIAQANWNHMIVGTSEICCIMENGQVCAVIIEESLPTDIRVVIKNGSSIFYTELYVKKQSEGTLVNVSSYMTEQELEVLELDDDKGLILCDKVGNALGEAYEGSFRIIKTGSGMVLVNELPIETYVKYVLPSEMPKTFHEEALKAQAVCARTFAYDQMSNQSYAMYGANLDDSTSFQVYHATGRFAETDAAVDATEGEVITCNGELITCYYFSTSAGMTNDMSVWGSKTPEYIKICSSEDTESPFYRWKAYLDISSVCEEERGKLKSVEVTGSNSSGYVTELKLIFDKETQILTKENDIRRALGTYLQETVLNNGKIRTDFSMIPSANFTVAEITDTQIVLEGGGFGHGIGMSQYGANQMAQNNFGYKAIIEHYYHNVVVKNI